MQTTSIFYFSGTGNTWWVSREMARLLSEREICTRTHSIEQLTTGAATQLMAECDTVGFGYPIYGSDLPGPMEEFIARMEAVEGKRCFVFCTQWLWSGDGARAGAALLTSKGFDVRWGEHFLMPNNVCVAVMPLPFTNERKRIDAVLAKASHRIERFVEKIGTDRSFRRGFHPLSNLLGSLQRVPFQRLKGRMQDDIGVDGQRCTRCGYCVSLCPVDNLVEARQSIMTRGQCIFCMRCYNFCPESAITYRRRPHNLRRGVPYRGPVEGFDPRILR